MTAPIFPNVEQIFDLLLGELPDNTYATDRSDDPDVTKRSVSSSEIRAHAQIYANLYDNLGDIYADKFVSTATVLGLGRWEKELFTEPQDPTQPPEVRRANALAQLRYIGGINYQAIYDLVSGVLTPLGIAFNVLPWNGCLGTPVPGAWILDETPLDYGTYLAARDPLWGAQRGVGLVPLDCNLNYAAAGITAQDLADIQTTAYTYEVQIYGNADAATLSKLDKRLTQKEPARSTHVIRNNIPIPDWIDPVVVDGGSFLGDYLWDSVDFGVLGDPPGTYDEFDFGGF